MSGANFNITDKLPWTASVRTITANTTLVDQDDIVLMDATSGIITATLPTAIGRTGKRYLIKRISSALNVPLVATSLSQTIDGVSTAISLATNFNAVHVVSDGANWLKINTL